MTKLLNYPAVVDAVWEALQKNMKIRSQGLTVYEIAEFFVKGIVATDAIAQAMTDLEIFGYCRRGRQALPPSFVPLSARSLPPSVFAQQKILSIKLSPLASQTLRLWHVKSLRSADFPYYEARFRLEVHEALRLLLPEEADKPDSHPGYAQLKDIFQELSDYRLVTTDRTPCGTFMATITLLGASWVQNHE